MPRRCRWRSKRIRSSPGCASGSTGDRKSTRLNSSHTEIYTLSLHDALPILLTGLVPYTQLNDAAPVPVALEAHPQLAWLRIWVDWRSEEHTSELQSHRDLHSFPTRRSSDLADRAGPVHAAQRCRAGAGGARSASAARLAAHLGRL